MRLKAFINRLAGDRAGAVLIEIALILPVLILMATGAFEVGVMVMRQQELQSALGNGEAIALAANQGAETNVAELKAIIKDEVGLDDGQVTLTKYYRCSTNGSLVSSADACASDEPVSEYVKFELRDVWTPLWADFGIGHPVNLSVNRMVQLS